MNRYALFAVIAGILALGFINYSIYENEKLLDDGEIIFLELAPVDPRSLMQGDYMALRFAIGNEIQRKLHTQNTQQVLNKRKPQDGSVVVKRQENGIAVFQGLGEHVTAPSERILRYRLRNGRVKFATNAFFFQEGTAQQYTAARYGEFHINGKGDILLTGMRDKELQRLGPAMKR